MHRVWPYWILEGRRECSTADEDRLDPIHHLRSPAHSKLRPETMRYLVNHTSCYQWTINLCQDLHAEISIMYDNTHQQDSSRIKAIASYLRKAFLLKHTHFWCPHDCNFEWKPKSVNTLCTMYVKLESKAMSNSHWATEVKQKNL